MKYVLLLIIFLFGNTLDAKEKILSYDVEVQVNKDRSVTVTEVLKVQVENLKINSGIRRSIPIQVRNEFGGLDKLELKVLRILKDGVAEPYHITYSDFKDVKHIYIGSKDVILDPGVYTYTIEYNLADQVGFFEDFDEIYWNGIPHGFDFEITEASVSVFVPEGAKIHQTKAYSGYRGDKGCACEVKVNGDSTEAIFITSRPLFSYQGMTVGVGFNKGIVTPLSQEQAKQRKYEANMPLMVYILGVGFLLVYYLIVWYRVGKDPDKGLIIPRFEPPKGYSPAAVRYVMRMKYDHKAFTATLVQMAVKGFLKFDKEKHFYRLKKIGDESILSKEEKDVAKQLFSDGDEIEVKQKNYSKLQSAMHKLHEDLHENFKKINFRINKVYYSIGFVLSIAVVITALVYLSYDYERLLNTLMVYFPLVIIIIPFMFLYIGQIKKARGFKKAFVITPGLAVFGYLSYFCYGLHLDGIIFVAEMSWIIPYIGLLFALVIINQLFLYLLKAPTTLGRRVMDEIEGLKMYLEVAEKRRLNIVNSPVESPELFEKLLPYAIALDVEKKWSERFKDILTKASESGNYSTRWYTDYRGFASSDFSSVSSNLGSSFSSSVSSASSSPSSSSGSSGGGFSGGGGGGGGGGGW